MIQIIPELIRQMKLMGIIRMLRKSTLLFLWFQKKSKVPLTMRRLNDYNASGLIGAIDNAKMNSF